jgi:UDP-glucuronate 4-epimerase
MEVDTNDVVNRKKTVFLVTGCAGFIGSHLCEKLVQDDNNYVYGIDNLNDYYLINNKTKLNVDTLKFKNLKIIKDKSKNNWTFIEHNMLNIDLNGKEIDIIINIGAMAGVGYSIEYPEEYIKNNILTHVHLLEQCKKYNIKKYIYASSSSVYGKNVNIKYHTQFIEITSERSNDHSSIITSNTSERSKDPSSVLAEYDNSDPFDNYYHCDTSKQESPYALSKKICEQYAEYYNRANKINTIGLRFFTVYGPRGRCDMAPCMFLDKIINNEQIKQRGKDKESARDYTYIDDIIKGIEGAIKKIDKINLNEKPINEIYNLGNNQSIYIKDFINTCYDAYNEVYNDKKLHNIQITADAQGDVPFTRANIDKAHKDLEYLPQTSIKDGLINTCKWMKSTYEELTIGIIGNGFVGGAAMQLECKDITVLAYDLDPTKCYPSNTTMNDMNICDIVFISVPTPMNSSTGECYLTYLECALKNLKEIRYNGYIVIRSTVPVGTCDKLNCYFMPEFLTEKNFKNDFITNKDWIFGLLDNDEQKDNDFKNKIGKLFNLAYKNKRIMSKELHFVKNKEAEMIKLFKNCFLATKVSFCNEIYKFCEKKEIDYETVRRLTTKDDRILGSHTLVPGHDGKCGFGGTCFPKDTSSLRHEMLNSGVESPILNAIIYRNNSIDRQEKDWAKDKGRAMV